jgi:hypothetical protein
MKQILTSLKAYTPHILDRMLIIVCIFIPFIVLMMGIIYMLIKSAWMSLNAPIL